MAIRFGCPKCQTPFSVDDKFAGRQAKCPGCQAVVTIPSPADVAAKPAAAATKPAASVANQTPAAAQPAPKRRSAAAAPAARSKPAPAAAPQLSDDLFDIDESQFAPAAPQPVQAQAAPRPAPSNSRCPACRAPMDASDRICVGCGFDRVANRRVGEGAKASIGKPALMLAIAVVVIAGGIGLILAVTSFLDRVYNDTVANSTPAPTQTVVLNPQQPGGPQAPRVMPGPNPAGNSGTNSAPPNRPAPPPYTVQPFDGWLQDFEAACAQAKRENKGVLIYFDGSDWCPYCVRMNNRVFFDRRFDTAIKEQYVLVHVDFPRQNSQAIARVENKERNDALNERFGVEGFPSIILTDTEGLPFAFTGYQEMDADGFVRHVASFTQAKQERDKMLAAVAQATGAAKLDAGKRLLKYLDDHDLKGHYGRVYDDLRVVADQVDPDNSAGRAEEFFEMSWIARLAELRRDKTDEVAKSLNDFEEWTKTRKFKDGNRGARLHVFAASLKAWTHDADGVRKHLETAKSYRPTEPDIAAMLQAQLAALRGISHGTGWVVASGGHIMTNHHVIAGPGKIKVAMPGRKEPLPALLVADDAANDMALIVIQGSPPPLTPLRVGRKTPLNRGERIAAFGFPLTGDEEANVKLTTGVIAGLPEQSTGKMLMLDCRVNPGNSGGPLCDAFGNVVGMVTAKTNTDRSAAVDSVGLALPADLVDEFLQKNLPAHARRATATPPARAQEWDQVDRGVSPSVVIVLKTSA